MLFLLFQECGQQVVKPNAAEYHQQHQRTKRVDLRRYAHLQHGIHLQRQGVGGCAGDEEGDDHVVHAHGERQQCAGKDRRGDQRQRHVVKSTGRACAQVTRCLDIGGVQPNQAALNIDEDVGNTEGRVCDDERQHAEGDADD